MNVYDFDKTIYDGDSTVDFYFYCVKKHPAVCKNLPEVLFFGLLFLLKIIKKTTFKSRFFKFILNLPDLECAVNEFWEKNKNKIKEFYIQTQEDDDLIISASPVFLLERICKITGIKNLIATEVDTTTGKITGENCYGEEKVNRLGKSIWRGLDIENFYSDSLSDTPLALLAKNSYIVNGEEIIPWKEYKN